MTRQVLPLSPATRTVSPHRKLSGLGNEFIEGEERMECGQG